jgi:putative inorganic carbon (HCO3(-)) transporter
MKKPNIPFLLPPAEYRAQAGLEVALPLVSATLIFLLTGLVGVWAAPNRALALEYFIPSLLSVGFFFSLAVAVRHKTETAFGILGLLCAIPIVLFTVYFGLTANWAANLPDGFIRVPWPWGQNPRLAGLPDLHKNMVGTILVVLLPFGFSGAIWAWTRRFRVISGLAVVSVLLGLTGLLMTGSRGAWLGFGLGIGYAACFFWRNGQEGYTISRRLVDLLAVGFALAATAGFFIVLKKPELEAVLAGFLGESVSRISIWRDSFALIQDYPFTGSGLGSTTMIYSSYVFLLHVPFFAHAHDLYLQIAIEQGLPGLIAFGAMVIFAILGLTIIFRGESYLSRLYNASTVAALIAMLWHGVVEAELLAHLFRPIIFLPFGFAFMLLMGNTPGRYWSRWPDRWGASIIIGASLAPLAAIIALFLWPNTASLLESNMGAVDQTRAELSRYHWPEWVVQDELRRNDAVDLSAALDHYEHALTIDPENVTAHRRLGQIEISTGEYDAARKHLEAAYHLAPDQRATRQMLGEVLAVTGDIEGAVSLWRLGDASNGQLDIRQGWYSYIGDQQAAQRVGEAIARLKALGSDGAE